MSSLSEIRDRWEQAQIKERAAHDALNVSRDAQEHYGNVYHRYFEYLGMKYDQEQKKILEIGPGDWPALWYCKRTWVSHIIEPLPSVSLIENMKGRNVEIIQQIAEFMPSFPKVDEVWLFNVLQHVMDPVDIINKAKACAKVIRFFEPIETAIDECHLQSFTFDFFKEHLGPEVIVYDPRCDNTTNFFKTKCAYGIWTKESR